MPVEEIPHTFGNGEFQIVRITSDNYEEALAVFQKNFLVYENVSIAADLNGSQVTRDEMKLTFQVIVEQGISFGAKHIPTGRLVGFSANALLTKNGTCNLDAAFKTFSSSNMLAVGDYLEKMEHSFDLYTNWDIDCVMEVVFLCTDQAWGQRRIGLTLFEHSIEYARRWKRGELTAEELAVLPGNLRVERPKAVCSTFTTLFTQKIGEKAGLKTVYKASFKEFSHNGTPFADKIDPMHEYSTFAAVKL